MARVAPHVDVLGRAPARGRRAARGGWAAPATLARGWAGPVPGSVRGRAGRPCAPRAAARGSGSVPATGDGRPPRRPGPWPRGRRRTGRACPVPARGRPRTDRRPLHCGGAPASARPWAGRARAEAWRRPQPRPPRRAGPPPGTGRAVAGRRRPGWRRGHARSPRRRRGRGRRRRARPGRARAGSAASSATSAAPPAGPRRPARR